MDPNMEYQKLVDALVETLNSSELPMCCKKDILHGLYVEASQSYNNAVNIAKENQAKNRASDDDVPQKPLAPLSTGNEVGAQQIGPVESDKPVASAE